MNFSSVGDLAQNLMLRRQSSDLSNQIDKLTKELVTGRQADISNAVRGDFSVAASLQRSLQLDDAYASVRKTLDAQLNAQQTALSAIAEPIGDLGLRVLNNLNTGDSSSLKRDLGEAELQLRSTISNLNTKFGNRSIFAGTSPGQNAVTDADTFLTNLTAATAGATTAADYIAAVDDWFSAPGGGFETAGFTGTTNTGDAIGLDENTKISPLTAADTVEIRNTLRDLALLSLAGRGAMSGDPAAQSELVQTGAQNLLQTKTGLTNLQADIGTRQALVEQTQTRAAAARFAMETTQNSLTAVDPYEAATQLEAARASLETLYVVTSRTSQLSLTDYLR